MALGTERRGTADYLQDGGSVCDLIKQEYNRLVERFNDLLVKLDADAGVTDADYESSLDDGLAQVKNHNQS